MKTPNRITWRWAERDYGFRFSAGSGRRSSDHYQAARPGEFYVIPAGQRKLEKERAEELAALHPTPTAPTVVASPWRDYADEDLQLIQTHDGLCLNWAGCLSREEINRRETDGINRAREFVLEFATREIPVPITLETIQRIHTEMFGDIYPWAGQWRTVTLSKSGITWGVPPYGMEIAMKNFAEHTLKVTPFLSEDPAAVLTTIARIMGEYLALHPFREGNGRSAFLLGEIILVQNGLLPFDRHQRDRDQARYYAACEAARTRYDYTKLSDLLGEWQGEAQARFEADHPES
jgi:cell filamentation protein